MKTQTKTEHRYIFTEKELKELLGLKGRIIAFEEWEGLPTNQIPTNIEATNKRKWGIRTEEGDVIL